jgi:NhaA family Na+:H+ antiporter
MGNDPAHRAIPPSAAERALRPFQEFARLEASGGIVLLFCALAAMAWANSPLAATYHQLFGTYFTVGWGEHALSKPLLLWINDGLMAVFFLVVGLEIKRELLVGELASPRRAALPIAAAAGGMLVPAAIYAAFNAGEAGARGWGIPMATDIAFSLGVLALLGRRVPLALRVFLAAFAIVDDLGAVLVIAVFYTEALSWTALGAAGTVLLLLLAANRAGVRRPLVYAVLGAALWLAVLKSGVHATVAGVLLAAAIPARARIDPGQFLRLSRAILEDVEHAGDPGRRQESVHELERLCEHVAAPLRRMEHGLHGWVAFLIMPLFALANAGVPLAGESSGLFRNPVGLGVILGLVAGKPLGITLASWLLVKAGLATLPPALGWRHLHGAAWLGGIGFTMSLFIAGLAFEGPPLLPVSKLAILIASLLAGVAGWAVLRTARSGAPAG